MPGDSISKHPDNKTEITFTQKDHSYIDNNGKRYMSVTTIISKTFPEFDAENIAPRCAAREGITTEEILNRWEEKRVTAANNGTRLHENCEYTILGKLDMLHPPRDANEKVRFDAAYNVIKSIKEKFHPESMEPEKIVFSPDFGIAGSIDLLVKINDLRYIIFDWKVLHKDLDLEGYKQETGNTLPTFGIQHSNYWHYALQLQIYENLLKSENYVNPRAVFSRFLLAWNGSKFNPTQVPDMPQAWALIAWRNKLK